MISRYITTSLLIVFGVSMVAVPAQAADDPEHAHGSHVAVHVAHSGEDAHESDTDDGAVASTHATSTMPARQTNWEGIMLTASGIAIIGLVFWYMWQRRAKPEYKWWDPRRYFKG